MAKAKPIHDLAHLLLSHRKVRARENDHEDLDQGTVIADVKDEWETFLETRLENKSEAGDESGKSRSKKAQKLHKKVVTHAKDLLAGGKEKHELVGLLLRRKLTSTRGKPYGETQIRTILQKAEILPPKKKRS